MISGWPPAAALTQPGQTPQGLSPAPWQTAALASRRARVRPAAPLRALQHEGVGKPPGVDIGGQLPLGRLVARKAFKSHPYSFSYRSMSVTKTVAPPTVTSTGKEA